MALAFAGRSAAAPTPRMLMDTQRPGTATPAMPATKSNACSRLTRNASRISTATESERRLRRIPESLRSRRRQGRRNSAAPFPKGRKRANVRVPAAVVSPAASGTAANVRRCPGTWPGGSAVAARSRVPRLSEKPGIVPTLPATEWFRPACWRRSTRRHLRRPGSIRAACDRRRGRRHCRAITMCSAAHALLVPGRARRRRKSPASPRISDHARLHSAAGKRAGIAGDGNLSAAHADACIRAAIAFDGDRAVRHAAADMGQPVRNCCG